MGKPRTLLEGLSEHAAALGADALDIQQRDGEVLVLAVKGGNGFSIAHYRSNGRDGKELLQNLHAALKRRLRTLLGGRPFLVKVTRSENLGNDEFRVDLQPAPPIDPSAPPFTDKQGQYLAFIFMYTKLHRRAPSEADLQEYFQVSPPSIHEMIKTLARNGLIEKTPGQARSIRVLVSPDKLPKLD